MRHLLISASILALGATFVAVHDSQAQANPPALSVQRVGLGLSGGIATYGQQDGLDHTMGGYLRLAGAYSTGKQLSLGVALQRDYTNAFNQLDAGVRLLVAGTGQGDKGQLALGAGYMRYSDDARVASQDSWTAGLYSSYNIANGPDKPVRWYAVGNAVEDQKNSRFSAQLGVLAAWSPYKSGGR